MAEWSTRPLWDLCDPDRGITYGIVKVGQFIPDGVPVIRGGDIRDNRIVFDDKKRVSHEVSDKFRRTVLRGGELLVNLIAEPGHSAITPMSMAGFNISRDVALVPLNECINHAYVNWYLKAPRAVEWLTARLSGSVTQKINLSILRELPILLPPRPYQDAIIEVLGALDDKITANQALRSACDEMLAARLEEHLADSATEACSRPLSSFAEFVNGKAFTKGASDTGRMVVRIAELSSGPGPSTVYNDIEVDSRHLVRPGNVLFAWSGSLTVARWFRAEAIINQHIFKVVPVDGVPTWLAFALVRSKLDHYKMIAAGKATTMGHIQRHHLDEPVLAPAGDAIAGLDDELRPLWKRALNAEQESLVLAELRDTLLPRLMSGELRVKDAEKVVEEAT